MELLKEKLWSMKLLVDGTWIPLDEVDFEDLSLSHRGRWRFKDPTPLQKANPQPGETILIPPKSAEAGLLTLAQAKGSK